MNRLKHRKLETTPEISEQMSNVKLKGGKTEIILTKSLRHNGVRYLKKLPGSPNIAIIKYNIALFVDGEFWHAKD